MVKSPAVCGFQSCSCHLLILLILTVCLYLLLSMWQVCINLTTSYEMGLIISILYMKKLRDIQVICL